MARRPETLATTRGLEGSLSLTSTAQSTALGRSPLHLAFTKTPEGMRVKEVASTGQSEAHPSSDSEVSVPLTSLLPMVGPWCLPTAPE